MLYVACPSSAGMATLRYRINGGGVKIIGGEGLEITRFNNDQGLEQSRGEVGKTENSRFLS